MLKIFIKTVVVFLFLFSINAGVQAQMTNPEDPGGDPEAGDPPLGGGAPIGESALLFLSFGMVYSGLKLIRTKNNKKE